LFDLADARVLRASVFFVTITTRLHPPRVIAGAALDQTKAHR